MYINRHIYFFIYIYIHTHMLYIYMYVHIYIYIYIYICIDLHRFIDHTGYMAQCNIVTAIQMSPTFRMSYMIIKSNLKDALLR